MPMQSSASKCPVVLLTNDDGPPSPSSPNIFDFCKLLKSRLNWDVKVVIPDSQKSWVGKAYAISDIVNASYFYPLEPDGLTGDITTISRPLKDGETMEWMLLSGTPATCTNIAIHNLYPGQIDLVISGPNHGRNSSTAFSLSSGTLGAALAAALSVVPSESPSQQTKPMPAIAVSYGIVKRPCPPRALELAADISVDICERLWRDWGYEDSARTKPVQVYSVNVPLVVEDLEIGKRKVVWTDMWRSTYGPLFKRTEEADRTKATDESLNEKKPNQPTADNGTSSSSTATAGPGALPDETPETVAKRPSTGDKQIKFKFAPTMQPLLFPPDGALPEGSDAWAFAKGYTSVTPLKAAYSGIEVGGFGNANGSDWKAGTLWEEETPRRSAM